MSKKRMTIKEKEEFDKLYEYVRFDIMGYDENQSLSRDMVLRLKGLAEGKFMANNKVKDVANYSYEVILNTFKYCSMDIQRALASVSFKDERHKFAYILKIVENNLNTVYVRLKNAEKAEEKVETIDTTIATYNGAVYKTKEINKNKKEKFSDLW